MIETDQPEVCAGAPSCGSERARTLYSDTYTPEPAIDFFVSSHKCTESKPQTAACRATVRQLGWRNQSPGKTLPHPQKAHHCDKQRGVHHTGLEDNHIAVFLHNMKGCSLNSCSGSQQQRKSVLHSLLLSYPPPPPLQS